VSRPPGTLAANALTGNGGLDVPIYEYRCDTCEETFELRRVIADSSAPASCPSGHVGARRVLSAFATIGRSPAMSPAMSAAPVEACGPGCACAAGF
jgi:putative FmdB family regulatory protein